MSKPKKNNSRGPVASAARRRAIEAQHQIRQLSIMEMTRDRIIREMGLARGMISAAESIGADMTAQSVDLYAAAGALLDVDRQIAAKRRELGLDPSPPPHLVAPEIIESLEAAGLHELRP